MRGIKKSKYEPISRALKLAEANGHERITYPFEHVEEIIGDSLPKSSKTYVAWWGNNYNQLGRQCQAWLKVGWETEKVDLQNQYVIFAMKKRY